tara:strand:+ start:152 stop:469 length:318 start_codon:yes stop_codon:yes gene_type:complete
MLKLLILLCTALVATLIIVSLIFPNESWIVVHSKKAEEYAVRLLANDMSNTPNWAIDLVVNKAEDFVSFSRHGSSSIIAYSPTEEPNIEYMHCESTWAYWYICDV